MQKLILGLIFKNKLETYSKKHESRLACSSIFCQERYCIRASLKTSVLSKWKDFGYCILDNINQFLNISFHEMSLTCKFSNTLLQSLSLLAGISMNRMPFQQWDWVKLTVANLIGLPLNLMFAFWKVPTAQVQWPHHSV